MKWTLALLVPVMMTGWMTAAPQEDSPSSRNQQAQEALQHLVQRQQSDMIQHRLKALESLYARPQADIALKTSQIRSDYLNAWAHLRQVVWTGVTVRVRTPSIEWSSPNRVSFYAIEREEYHYYYRSLPQHPLTFGIASRHHLSLIDHHGQYLFSSDDFTNPVLPSSVAGAEVPQQIGGHPNTTFPSDGAKMAVEYANNYCGNAPGCRNEGHYNSDYQNYNGNGGDCTNFISQVLYAGGFRMTPGWTYDQETDEGSAAWANAGDLARFLKTSRRATPFAHGSYAQVTHPTPISSGGAIEQLRLGDLISYQEHGRIVHTAVIAGYDPKGVPLTIAHTNDRYHVPWDFGWSNHTTFYLWHVHYPDNKLARKNR